MSAEPEIWPTLNIGLAPLPHGALVPGMIVAALERCSLLKCGTIRIRIHPSNQPFLHYSELPCWSLDGVGPHAQPKTGNDEDAGAEPPELDQSAIRAGERAVDDGYLPFDLNIETDGDGDLDGAHDEDGLPLNESAFLPLNEPHEVRDWTALSDFLCAERFDFPTAEGCLVTTEAGTFLATFQPLPRDGGRIR